MSVDTTNNTTTAVQPLGPYPRIVTAKFDVPGIDRLDVYREHGGYDALAKALTSFQPEQLAEEVKQSGLRGRGRAGLPDRGATGSLPPPNGPTRRLSLVRDHRRARI